MISPKVNFQTNVFFKSCIHEHLQDNPAFINFLGLFVHILQNLFLVKSCDLPPKGGFGHSCSIEGYCCEPFSMYSGKHCEPFNFKIQNMNFKCVCRVLDGAQQYPSMEVHSLISNFDLSTTKGQIILKANFEVFI